MNEGLPHTSPSRTQDDPALRYGGRFRHVTHLRSHAARGTIINGLYQIGVTGLSGLKGIVAATLISRSDYGVWGLLGLALWTVVGFRQQFGVNDKYVQQSDLDQQLAFQQGFTVEIVIAAALIPAMAIVVPIYALLAGHSEIIAPGLALGLLLPTAALQFPLWTFYREMDFRRQRMIQALDPVVSLFLTVALALAGAGYWSLVIGLLGGSAATATLALRLSPYPFAWRFDRSVTREYLSYSAPLLVAGLATIAVFQTVYLAGSHTLGLIGLGAFTLTGNLVQFTDQADTIITETLYPALCAVRDRRNVLFEAFTKSNRLALMWAVPFGVGLSLFASDLIRFVIGERWLPAVGLLQIMGVVTAVHHIGFNWHAFYKAQGRTWPIAVVAVVSATATVGCAIPLMANHGLVGLGWAFAAGEAVALLVRTAYLARYFRGFRMVPHMLRALAPTTIGATAALGIRALVAGPSSLLEAVVQLAVFLLVTGVTAILLERRLLGEALGYLLKRPSWVGAA